MSQNANKTSFQHFLVIVVPYPTYMARDFQNYTYKENNKPTKFK